MLVFTESERVSDCVFVVLTFENKPVVPFRTNVASKNAAIPKPSTFFHVQLTRDPSKNYLLSMRLFAVV